MPTLRTGSAATNSGTSAVTALTLAVPSGTQVGDLICCYMVAAGSGRTFTNGASGYTTLAANNPNTAGLSAAFQYKTAVSGDLGANMFPNVSGSGTTFAAVVWSVAASSGFDPTPTAGGDLALASTTVAGVGITTTLNGDLLFWAGVTRSGSTGGAPGTITLPSGFSSVVAESSSTNTTKDNVGVILGDVTQVTGGATGNENGSVSPSQANGAMVIAFADTSSGVSRSLTVAQETIAAPAPTATVGAVSLALTRAQETVAAPAPTASVSSSVSLPVAQATIAAPAPTAPTPTLFVALPVASVSETALPLFAYTGPAIMPATGSTVH